MVKHPKKQTSEETSSDQPPKPVKKRTAPTNTSLLPPCKVCHEPAAGFHYGANTCEACKGFFRRTLVRDGDYECVNGDEKCVVVLAKLKGKKRICSRCRHLKCLAVGMSLHAVKTGRYTHTKRTQDILEYKQVMGQSSAGGDGALSSAPSFSALTVSNTGATHGSATSTNIAPASVNRAPASATNHAPTSTNYAPTSTNYAPASTNYAPTSTSYAPTSTKNYAPTGTNYAPTSTNYAPTSTNHIPPSSATLLSSSSDSSYESAFTPFQSSAACRKEELSRCAPFPSNQECDPSSSQFATLKPAQFSTLRSSPFGRLSLSSSDVGQFLGGDSNCQLLGPSHWQSLLSASSFVDGMFNCVAEAEPGQCNSSLSVSSEGSVASSSSSPLPVSLWDSSPPSSSSSGEAGSSGGGGGGDMSDEECRILTQHILQSYAASNFAKYTQSAEEILEKQKLCYENFRARIEVFGPLENLSEEDYQEVYQSTGIDVDNRQSFISTLSKVVEDTIHEYIRFAKGIPGFTQLSMKDKITLIKDNRAEVMAIAQTTGYNHDLQVFALPSGRTFSMYDMERIGGKERQKVRCECLHAIQRLGLSKEENILFKCVVLFTVGKDDVEEPERVSAMQWKMVQCLRWLLTQNKRPRPDIVFARIIAVFGRLREFATIFYEWLKSKPFAHYAQFKQNELLAEWFSNS
ncbi:hypothetical protein ACOMHN_045082 [Nucella lapillus]